MGVRVEESEERVMGQRRGIENEGGGKRRTVPVQNWSSFAFFSGVQSSTAIQNHWITSRDDTNVKEDASVRGKTKSRNERQTTRATHFLPPSDNPDSQCSPSSRRR